MKKLLTFLMFIFITGCQITETISLNPDGSGTIEVVAIRDENSYMQLSGVKYNDEERFKDTTFVFNEFITKYAENFSKLPLSEKVIFNKYKDVKVYIKESSFEKEFKSTFIQDFNKAESIADLYKTEDYASDLQHNYALSAEDHYFNISYYFDGTLFKRMVKITNHEELKRKQNEVEEFKKQTGGFKLVHSITLNYNFPRKIKSVSYEKAVVSPDKKSVHLVLPILDYLQNPEIGNLEVVLD
ncbi:hypothetical protein [Flavobacterium sp. HTF]|uniref:hypothetical protein n=1 Tax=Flavobacterium sp. HTF TaxID=2170732 RepID=UPI000D5F2F06|nr:hypothetical protein [Flavobacterium sp. HTF]PWB26825.1 hypothetical protein DCO46_05035 [Flavobacterium sp. HTF]